MRKLFLLLIILFCIPIVGFAQNYILESIYLKDGSIIRGVIIEQIPNESVKIQLADGSISVYNMDRVEKIAKESIPTNSSVYQNPDRNNYSDRYRERDSYGNSRYRSRYDRDSYQQKHYDITGYRGFIDLGYTVGLGDLSVGRLEVSTSHGAQINPFFFVGLGTGINYLCTNGFDDVLMPLFVDFRGSFLDGTISPVIGLKAGMSIDLGGFNAQGLYLAPSIGARFMMSETTAVNVSIGYTYQKVDIVLYGSGWSYDDSYNLGGLSFKFGFEF